MRCERLKGRGKSLQFRLCDSSYNKQHTLPKEYGGQSTPTAGYAGLLSAARSPWGFNRVCDRVFTSDADRTLGIRSSSPSGHFKVSTAGCSVSSAKYCEASASCLMIIASGAGRDEQAPTSRKPSSNSRSRRSAPTQRSHAAMQTSIPSGRFWRNGAQRTSGHA